VETLAIVEDEALVLRSMRYRETSRIATLLTRRFGKVAVIAKAAREMRSPFGGALEILTCSRVIFYLKKNRQLHLLKSASLERAYWGVLTRPATYHLACAALEFVHKVVPDEDPCPEVYETLAQFLGECDQGSTRGWEPAGRGAVDEQMQADPRDSQDRGRMHFKVFQLRVVSLLGYTPQITDCARCGGSLEAVGGFGVAEGGLLCRACAREGDVLPISAPALQALRALALDSRVGGRPAGALPAADREVARIVEAFLRYHLTGYQGLRSLKSLADWGRIRKSGAG
jgi:DNA repair protein RecO (recombination protein O)